MTGGFPFNIGCILKKLIPLKFFDDMENKINEYILKIISTFQKIRKTRFSRESNSIKNCFMLNLLL